MAPGAIWEHISSIPPDQLMQDLLDNQPEVNSCAYVSTPGRVKTEFMDPEHLHLIKPRSAPRTNQPDKHDQFYDANSSFDNFAHYSSTKPTTMTTMTAYNRRHYRKRSTVALTDQLDLTLVMPPAMAEQLELHDPDGAVPALARYLFDIIESYHDLRKRAGTARAAASTHLERLHGALLQAGKEVDVGGETPEERHWKIVRAVEDIAQGGDPFGSLLDDLRQLAGQRKEALAKVDALKKACELDISSERRRRKLTAVAFWLALAALLGVILGNMLNFVVLGAGAGAAKGAFDMFDLYKKGKEEVAKDKKKEFDDVAQSVRALGKVEEDLERVVNDYRSFRGFMQQFEARLMKGVVDEQREIEEAIKKTAEAKKVVEKVEKLEGELKTAADAAEAKVHTAASSLNEAKLEAKYKQYCCGPCCTIM